MRGPLDIRHIDLSESEGIDMASSNPTYFVFWWKSLPLGTRPFLPGELPLGTAQLRAIAADYCATQLAARSPAFGETPRATFEGWPKFSLSLEQMDRAKDLVEMLEETARPSSQPGEDVSVIICTRNREQALSACLKSIEAQSSRPGELIVVDNSAEASARTICEAFPYVHWVHEPKPGLSAARNAGILASTKPIVLFTDDDVEPHPNWIAEIVRAFSNPDTDAVSGLVLPAELQTDAQQCFQLDMGGFGNVFVPRIFDHRFFEETRSSGAHVWHIGAGANMAFRRSAFDLAGLFDERLGAGAAGCSEDSELWYRLLARGGICFYEPRAVVFHHHRKDWSGLKRQVRAYMRGHVAALIAQHDRFGDRGNLRRIFRQIPRYFFSTFVKTFLEGTSHRRRILKEEMIGWAMGLPYLLRFGWRRRTASWPRQRGDQA